MARITTIRYGKVVPDPAIKFSTIRIELEAEVGPDDNWKEVYNGLRVSVGKLVNEEAAFRAGG